MNEPQFCSFCQEPKTPQRSMIQSKDGLAMICMGCLGLATKARDYADSMGHKGKVYRPKCFQQGG